MEHQAAFAMVSGMSVEDSPRLASSRLEPVQVKTCEGNAAMVNQKEEPGARKLQFSRVYKNLRALVLDVLHRERRRHSGSGGGGGGGRNSCKGNTVTVVAEKGRQPRPSRSLDEPTDHNGPNDSLNGRCKGGLCDTNNKNVLDTLSTIRSSCTYDEEDSWDPVVDTMSAPLDDTAARIRPGLYISGFLAEQNKEDLASKGITHILQVGENLTRSYEGDFQYKSLEIMDTSSTNVLPKFKESLQFLQDCISTGGVVLVHCYAGISRSATICIAYLMWSENLSVGAAYSLVERARSVAQPNEGFRQQLQVFESLGSNLNNLDRYLETVSYARRSRCRELSSDDWEVLL